MSALRVLVLLSVFGTAQGQTDDIETQDVRNPFARPVTVIAPDARTRGRATQKAVRVPKLHALLAAGPNSVANLDGKVMAIGEQHKGYRLLSVAEDAASFRYNGRDVTLRLNTAPAADRKDAEQDKGRGSSNGRD